MLRLFLQWKCIIELEVILFSSPLNMLYAVLYSSCIQVLVRRSCFWMQVSGRQTRSLFQTATPVLVLPFDSFTSFLIALCTSSVVSDTLCAVFSNAYRDAGILWDAPRWDTVTTVLSMTRPCGLVMDGHSCAGASIWFSRCSVVPDSICAVFTVLIAMLAFCEMKWDTQGHNCALSTMTDSLIFLNDPEICPNFLFVTSKSYAPVPVQRIQ